MKALERVSEWNPPDCRQPELAGLGRLPGRQISFLVSHLVEDVLVALKVGRALLHDEDLAAGPVLPAKEANPSISSRKSGYIEDDAFGMPANF